MNSHAVLVDLKNNFMSNDPGRGVRVSRTQHRFLRVETVQRFTVVPNEKLLVPQFV